MVVDGEIWKILDNNDALKGVGSRECFDFRVPEGERGTEQRGGVEKWIKESVTWCCVLKCDIMGLQSDRSQLLG